MLIYLGTAEWTLRGVLQWAPVKVWFYSVQGSYFILSRMGNKMIYQLDDSWKHHENPLGESISVQILPCFAVKFQIHFVLDIVHYLKALFFWSILMQYMLFSSVTGDADMWCQKTSERLSVFTHDTKKASRLRDCVIPKTFFFATWNFTIDRPFSQ